MQVSNSTNAARFSAVCYLTAKHIAEMLWSDAPFGLIWASWGGTRVEAWAPAAANKAACPSAAAMPPMAGPQEYSVLYNGMIHPLTKYSIRGAFWFQVKVLPEAAFRGSFPPPHQLTLSYYRTAVLSYGELYGGISVDKL